MIRQPAGRPGKSSSLSTHTLTVTARDLTKIGDILGAAQAAGVNSVGGVSFTLEDPTQAISQARALAVADARARADQIAKGLGVKIVRVLVVNENGASVPMPADKGFNAVGIGGGGGSSGADPGGDLAGLHVGQRGVRNRRLIFNRLGKRAAEAGDNPVTAAVFITPSAG